MSTNYKHQYEQMKLLVEKYQDEIVPGLRKLNSDILADVEKNFVKVVRCKKCKIAMVNPFLCDEPQLVCRKWADWHIVNPEDFCSYGERKDT